MLRLAKNYVQECSILTKIYGKDTEKYDLAIAYSTPVSLSNYYVIDNISSSKKIMYLHNDVKEINISPFLSEKLYQNFDGIIAVSKSCKRSYVECFPYLENKVYVIENLININEIVRLSLEPLQHKFDKDAIHICTVGRIEYEKGQDIIPSVLQLLKNSNSKIRWHLVGYGSLEDDIKKEADKLDVSEMIIFEGYQTNPYNFMLNCDIYIQTSRQEGFGITLKEAKILKKMIISTNFPCAYEQISDNQTGLIVKFDSAEIANSIKKIIENSDLKEFIIKNLESLKWEDDLIKLDYFLKEVFYDKN